MKRLIVLLALLAVAPLFHPLYMWGAHDGRHSVYFLVEFDRSVQDGVFWPRWAPDFAFGYGYPIFNIYAPLAYFVAEGFHLAGIDFVGSVKIVFGLSFVLSGLAMYWFARDTLGTRGALLAAVVYMYTPYRLVDVYVRGALSESVAFIFFPLVLGSFRRLLSEVQLRRISGVGSPARAAAIAGFCLAGLVLSHTTVALIFIPITAGYVLWSILASALEESSSSGDLPDSGRLPLRAILGRIGVTIRGATEVGERNLLRRAMVSGVVWSAFAGITGLGLSAIFWLPMLFEYNDVRVDQWNTAEYDLRSHFVYLHQLVSPLWGFGLSRPGPDDDMSFQLGVIPFVLGALGVVAGRRPGAAADRLFFALLGVGVTATLLPVTEPLWQAVRPASLVQFPWRLLAISTLAFAVLAGLVVSSDPREPGSSADDRTQDVRDRVGQAALIVAALFASYGYLSPQMIEPPEGPVSLGGLMRFQETSGELVGLTRWNETKPTTSPLKRLYEAGQPITSKIDPATVPLDAQAETVRRSSILEEIRVQTARPFRLGIFTQRYPGWSVSIDGQPATLGVAPPYGLMTVDVPAGARSVVFRFDDTPPRTTGQIITGLSLIGVLVLAVRGRWWSGLIPLRQPARRRAVETGEPTPAASGDGEPV